MVSVDVKQHCTMLTYWSQFVPNTSDDIGGHEALHLHHHHVTSEVRSCVEVEVDSWDPVPIKPTVSVDLKQHFIFDHAATLGG